MREAEALFDAGLERLGDGDAEAAVAAMRKALELDPGYRDAAHGLIRALDRAGRDEEALAAAQALIATEPDDVLARTSLSMILQKMGRTDEAEKAGLQAKLLGWKHALREGEGAGFSTERPLWYVATTNAGKMRDFGAASQDRVRLEPLPGLVGIVPPEEDETTFEGNAALKARYYSRNAPGVLVLADDSGLEVDGLGGAPGVRSARYAEDAGFLADSGLAVDARNNLCLLDVLRDVTGDGRRGRYRCVLAAARDGEVVATAAGKVEGRILEVERGGGGFGYDPLFEVEGAGRTMAELGMEERLVVSHRGKALRALLEAMGV